MCSSAWIVYCETKVIKTLCEGTDGEAFLPASAVIYVCVETGARGPMLVEAMTEVEKMDLRLSARGPASTKCECRAPAGLRRLGLCVPGSVGPWLAAPPDYSGAGSIE